VHGRAGQIPSGVRFAGREPEDWPKVNPQSLAARRRDQRTARILARSTAGCKSNPCGAAYRVQCEREGRSADMFVPDVGHLPGDPAADAPRGQGPVPADQDVEGVQRPETRVSTSHSHCLVVVAHASRSRHDVYTDRRHLRARRQWDGLRRSRMNASTQADSGEIVAGDGPTISPSSRKSACLPRDR
jgi:hypothetical protein